MCAVFLRVGTKGNVLAGTGTVAGSALATLEFLVVVVGVVGTGTLTAIDVAGSAFSVAGHVAAEAIDTEAGEAGIGTLATSAVVQLRSARP